MATHSAQGHTAHHCSLSSAKSVVVQDELATGFSLLEGSLTHKFATIAPGATESFTYVVAATTAGVGYLPPVKVTYVSSDDNSKLVCCCCWFSKDVSSHSTDDPVADHNLGAQARACAHSHRQHHYPCAACGTCRTSDVVGCCVFSSSMCCTRILFALGCLL